LLFFPATRDIGEKEVFVSKPHSAPPRVLRRLSEVRDDIADADLLLFRRWGLISIAGRSPYSHGAMAAWWGDDLMVLEVREWHGGRAVTLASQVKRFPGRIDVYRCGSWPRWPEFDRDAAVAMMRRFMGCRYGWGAVLRVAMCHLPIVRLFARVPAYDPAKRSLPPFCTDVISLSIRDGGGVDPVPNLADRATEPGDLARSPFFEYQFTLA
jgi:hypothetical protein